MYANSQILMQHDGDSTADRYFYLHDRLGSVRMVIDANGTVMNNYTYGPFGEMKVEECNETVSNPFKFTGQYFDSETGQYYLRARQYDPQLMRLTTHDPIRGAYKEPMSLHKYLYVLNNPINDKDPSGEMGIGTGFVGETIIGMSAYHANLDASLQAAGGDTWAILDAAIAANIFREDYFNYEREEGMMGRPTELVDKGKAIKTLYNACEWRALGNCILPVVNEFLVHLVAKKIGGGWSLDALGKAACTSCALEPTKVTCIPCIAYIGYEAWGYYGLGMGIADCVEENCGK